jgi:arginase
MRQSSIAIIGAPLDLGAGRRGVDMGPSAIRVAHLNDRLRSLGYKVEDWGNIAVDTAESLPAGPKRARFLPQIADACERIANKVESALAASKFPVVLGGDHSLATGSVSGVSHFHRQRGEKIGVIWFDAHADMNTPETSPSGNVHGMPLACLIGKGPKAMTHICGFSPKVDPRNVVLVGIRDVDSLEAPLVKRSGVRCFTMRAIDELGLPRVMEEAIAIASSGTAGIHFSLDMDAIDPDLAPGVGTPVPGGFTYREAHLAMEMVADSNKLLSLEAVEVNPVLDVANRTATLAVECLMSALGKRIL